MKKTYSTPQALTVVLNAKSSLMEISGHDEEGNGNQLTKENVGGNDVTNGGKNVWDEEW